MGAECGKDSAACTARKGFRAERRWADRGVGPTPRMPTQSRGHGTRRKGFRAERFGGVVGHERSKRRAEHALPWCGRSAPCFVGATWRGSDLPYLLRDSFGGACPRKAVGMAPGGPALPAGGGLASLWALNAERIPQRVRPGKDSGPSGDGPTGASALQALELSLRRMQRWADGGVGPTPRSLCMAVGMAAGNVGGFGRSI